MDISYIGILGGIILVLGAMWRIEETKNPRHSIKNWLFGAGNICMFLFALLNYLWGEGAIFFVILESLIIISTIFIFFPINEKKSTTILSVIGAGCLIWSLALFESYLTVFFILGLLGVAIGFAFEMGSFRRSLFLFLGSFLIALFSYLEASWIFFWLNAFFSIFSGIQAWGLRKR